MNVIEIERNIRLIFIKSGINLYGEYPKFVTFIDDLPLFNKNSFLSLKSVQERKFFEELTETQTFNLLFQNKNIDICFPYFYQESLKYINDLNLMTTLPGANLSLLMQISSDEGLFATNKFTSEFINENNTKKLIGDNDVKAINDELFLLKPSNINGIVDTMKIEEKMKEKSIKKSEKIEIVTKQIKFEIKQQSYAFMKYSLRESILSGNGQLPSTNYFLDIIVDKDILSKKHSINKRRRSLLNSIRYLFQ